MKILVKVNVFSSIYTVCTYQFKLKTIYSGEFKCFIYDSDDGKMLGDKLKVIP